MNPFTPPHDPGSKIRPLWPADSNVKAKFSPCTCYRYELSEIWNPKLPLIMWLLMNPSVANEEHSDRTLRRTGTFARDWGYGGQLVGNVHAYRATDKKELLTVPDPNGPDNDAALLAMAQKAKIVILGYGQPPSKALRSRGPQVVEKLRAAGASLHILRLLNDGTTPEHPLYLPGTLTPTPY